MKSSRIFIQGLPPNFSSEDFQAHFSKQANVTDIKSIPQRRIGYVGYKTPEDATKAVKYYNKTFIRMSRIGVEIARSVEEQHALRPVTNATNGVKRKYGAISGDPSNPPAEDVQYSLKPRNVGGQPAEGKAKLQEFLDVMQPPSKSKIWENQAAPSNQAHAQPFSFSEKQVIIDAKSDDDYESVPKKPESERKKSEKDELASRPLKLATTEMEHAMLEEETGKHSKAPPLAEQDEQQTTNEIATTVNAASDADWLRSRTSRLLGLVGDDVTFGTTALSDDIGQPNEADQGSHQQINNDAADPIARINSGGQSDPPLSDVAPLPGNEDTILTNGRLFVRNLTYTTTVDELKGHFESGNYGILEEVHIPTDSRTGNNKGFAYVQYAEPEAAALALRNLDRRPFQGRLLHLMPANAKNETGLDDFAISKLPLKKQQQIKRKSEAASSTFNWNFMYMNPDAVISSISDRLSISKADLLDPTSSDAAVKQAHAETHIIHETRSFFKRHGVDFEAFKRKERGDTAILVKNFPYGTKPDELRTLFEPHGLLTRILMPPAGTMAILEYDHPDHARSAFASLAYRRFKDAILFLEKAPKALFDGEPSDPNESGLEARKSKLSAKDLLDEVRPQEPVNTSTLFVRNLNFSTTTQRLREIFQPLGGLLSARVKTKPNPKKPGQILSMGFGFLEFQTNEYAQAALSAMDGYKLDGHELIIRASHRAIDAAAERRKDDQAKKAAGKKTKIIIKNLPFEASRKDVLSLFGAYGQLRSVRVPKKFDSSTRGFAFAEFITAREAENAMDALRDTHLLGRRLVLEFAAEDAVDPEQEIEKMQQKVGKQADKVALQKLTGTARKKFNVEGGEEMEG